MGEAIRSVCRILMENKAIGLFVVVSIILSTPKTSFMRHEQLRLMTQITKEKKNYFVCAWVTFRGYHQSTYTYLTEKSRD